MKTFWKISLLLLAGLPLPVLGQVSSGNPIGTKADKDRAAQVHGGHDAGSGRGDPARRGCGAEATGIKGPWRFGYNPACIWAPTMPVRGMCCRTVTGSEFSVECPGP